MIEYSIFLLIGIIMLIAIPGLFDGIALVFKGLYYLIYSLFVAIGTVSLLLLMIAASYYLLDAFVY